MAGGNTRCTSKRRAAEEVELPALDIPDDDQDAEEAAPAPKPPTAKKRKSQGKGAQAATQRTAGADADAAGPSTAAATGNTANNATNSSRVERIPLDKEELKLMNAKIEEYSIREAEAREKHQQALGLSTPELDALAAKVVRAMLFKAHEKPGVPVKRDELVELVKADYKEHKAVRRMPALAIPMAQAKMICVFGIEMRELQRAAAANPGKKVKAPDAEAAVSTTYVLRSVVPTALRRALVQDPREDASRALLMVVLALIALNGDRMDADELWRHLRQVGVPKEDPHPVLGDIKQWLADLEKTRYLIKTSRNTPNGQEWTYEWGENATDEIGKRAVKDFAEKEFAEAAERAVLGPAGDNEEELPAES